ncbi:MAG: riboflavin synthase [Flavobacteriales bacterium]|nr:riboflavin synthase [Flavobacteriales bacterium]
MFTGIVETLGTVKQLEREGGNLHITVESNITSELKIDQSVAHNGVCLTVIEINNAEYIVTAIDETLQKTNLGSLNVGDGVNLERCMQMNGRLDGHMVQGHVDTTGTCTKIEQQDGSWKFTFTYSSDDVTVTKGSITINGVSLTVVDSLLNQFSVCIIPYTYENTSFKSFKIDSKVNLEFDIIGKYVARLMS